MKRILILGADGYLGWTLLNHLVKDENNFVIGFDNGSRREFVAEMKSDSIVPILSFDERIDMVKSLYNNAILEEGDLLDYNIIEDCLRKYKPNVIVHLAEQPSAPFSMMDVDHATFTHTNNVNGTLNLLHAIKEVDPNIHLVKLGTMGEYGTPNYDISEGDIELVYKGKLMRIPFPKQPGSWYHLTKLHDTNNIMFACKVWGLRCTDIMQGIVFGTKIDAIKNDENLNTRFDIDECFGTAINRFCAQAIIGRSITPYGKGEQKRGFLPLKDSIQCLNLIINNPAKQSEYNIINQFEKVYNINQLAHIVKDEADALGLLNAKVQPIENPRKEKEEHYYNPEHKKLLELGYKPSTDIKNEIRSVLLDLLLYKERIIKYKDSIAPKIKWI